MAPWGFDLGALLLRTGNKKIRWDSYHWIGFLGMKQFFFLITHTFLLLLSPVFAEMDIPEPSHDFGVVDPYIKVEHVFRVLNRGKEEMVIEQVRPSCGCTAAVVSEKVIPPGKEGTIRVEYDPEKGRFGKFHKSVKVFIKGEKEPILLSVSGEVKKGGNPETSPVISVTPAKVDLGELKPGEEKPFSLVIENKGKGPLYIKNFTAGHKNSGTPLNQKAIEPGKRIQATLSYTADKKGAFSDVFIIKSNDPVSSVLSIPVFGNVKEEK